MLYRTLHSYILRELLRVFLLTASALTTLMAFGGMFKPVTKQGIDVSQLMVILVNLMPAMMAYAIPIAGLFAAVLVYWRMSTDNELTACRAGGVSFIAIVLPAFVLGLAVASADLVFLNYVVPRFLQATERAVVRDLGSLIVNQISRQEKFIWDTYAVSADSAELQKNEDGGPSVVLLHGMNIAALDKAGRPFAFGMAQEAQLTIRNLPAQDSAEMDIRLVNGTGFDLGNTFRKVGGSLDTITRPIPSFLKSKAKYLNLRRLRELAVNPWPFPTVSDAVQRVETDYTYDQLGRNILNRFSTPDGKTGSGGAITFPQMIGGNNKAQITLTAPGANRNSDPPDKPLTFTGTNAARVRVEQRINDVVKFAVESDFADMAFATDPFSGKQVTVSLILRGRVVQANNEPNQKPFTLQGDKSIEGLLLDPALTNVTPSTDLIAYARASDSTQVRKLGATAEEAKTKLFQTIDSELHSRGSFSLSCLTLVLFGAALGILLRGRNPLAVFVLGFVPAIVLVLLITAGRQVTEGNPKNVSAGIAMIWAGNAVLILLVAGVYGKLLRR